MLTRANADSGKAREECLAYSRWREAFPILALTGVTTFEAKSAGLVFLAVLLSPLPNKARSKPPGASRPAVLGLGSALARCLRSVIHRPPTSGGKPGGEGGGGEGGRRPPLPPQSAGRRRHRGGRGYQFAEAAHGARQWPGADVKAAHKGCPPSFPGDLPARGLLRRSLPVISGAL